MEITEFSSNSIHVKAPEYPPELEYNDVDYIYGTHTEPAEGAIYFKKAWMDG